VRSGKIVRHPCVICDEKKVEGHHWDYSKPLDVFWLCRAHHVAVHDRRNLPAYVIRTRGASKDLASR
jgi:hypothetical protein